jgi:chromosome partitioning protein
MKSLAVYSVKGGVGKTSAAVNLAWLAAKEGMRTLIWDLDPQAASTFYLRVRPKRGGAKRILSGASKLSALVKGSNYPNLDVLPARFSFRRADTVLDARTDASRRFSKLIAPLEQHYDLLVFDCAPGLSLIAESVMHAADGVLVPVIPTTLSLRTLTMLHDHCASQMGSAVALLPFLSMVDVRRRLHRDVCNDPSMFAVAPLSTRIPYASQVERMGVERAPLCAFAPSSLAGRAYAGLWREVHSAITATAK